MHTRKGSRRDFKALEKRRLTATRLFAAGDLKDAEIARRLGASPQSVLCWRRDWTRGGPKAVRAAGRAGRRPKLAEDRLQAVEAALRQGLLAFGFRTDLWTLPRLAGVIARQTGVRYHPGHVWRLMRHLGWSLQRPATRARERDEAAIRRWVSTRWPAVKKNARRQRAWLVFEDESGVSERPAIRRTWAHRGHTPVLTHAFNWKHLSVAIALAFRCDGRQSHLDFQTRPGSYSGASLISVVRALKRHFRGTRIILIWDRLPAHRSRQWAGTSPSSAPG